MAQASITTQDLDNFKANDGGVAAFNTFLAKFTADNIRQFFDVKVGGFLGFGGELPVDNMFGKVINEFVAEMQGNHLETDRRSTKKIEEVLLLLYKFHEFGIEDSELLAVVDKMSAQKQDSLGELTTRAAAIMKQIIVGHYEPINEGDKLGKFTLKIDGYSIGENPQNHAKILLPNEGSNVRYILWHDNQGMVNAEAVEVSGAVNIVVHE